MNIGNMAKGMNDVVGIQIPGTDAVRLIKPPQTGSDPQLTVDEQIMLSLQQQLAAAREAMQAAEVDAARYRWLRDKANDIEADGPLVFMTGRNGHPVGHIWDSILYGESLDAAIDATLQRDRQP